MDMDNRYNELVQALGYDPTVIDHEMVIRAAGALNRLRLAVVTSKPETSGAMFICGIAGDKDQMGLPEYVDICPTYGLDGFARYKKDTDYSAPGY
jgi:hypothetical protein